MSNEDPHNRLPEEEPEQRKPDENPGSTDDIENGESTSLPAGRTSESAETDTPLDRPERESAPVQEDETPPRGDLPKAVSPEPSGDAVASGERVGYGAGVKEPPESEVDSEANEKVVEMPDSGLTDRTSIQNPFLQVSVDVQVNLADVLEQLPSLEFTPDDAEGNVSSADPILHQVHYSQTKDSNYARSSEKPSWKKVQRDQDTSLEVTYRHLPILSETLVYNTVLPNLVEVLQSKRILFLSCIDKKTADATANKVAHDAVFSDHKKWIMQLSNEEADAASISNLIDGLKDQDGQALFVVEIKKIGLFDSISRLLPMIAHTLMDNLKSRHQYLICIIDWELVKGDFESIHNFPFSYHSIDFLPHLLFRSLPEEPDIEGLVQKIIAQRQQHLWDFPDNVQDFYQLLLHCLKQRTLDEAIETREKYQEGDDLQMFRKEHLEPVKAKDLLAEASALDLHILFVACFFPGLNWSEFEGLLVFLLGNQTMMYDVTSHIQTETGETKLIKNQEERIILDIWKSNRDRIFRSCHLQFGRTETGAEVVEFSHPALENSIKEGLERGHRFFIYEKFRGIQQLIFHPDHSEQLTDSIIRLSAAMAVAEPTAYGKNWLSNIMYSIDIQLYHVTQRANQGFQNMEDVVDFFYQNDLVPLFIRRLAELMRAMLGYVQLKQIVEDFLRQLTKETGYALDIILRIALRLQYSPQFDWLYWVRQIIDQGPKAKKQEAYAALLRYALHNTYDIYALLDRLKNWLPEPKREPSRFAFSNIYGLQFIIDYAAASAQLVRPGMYGQWPPKYGLFAKFQEDPPARNRYIKQLIAGLFDRRLEMLGRYAESAPGGPTWGGYTKLNVLRADLLEAWHHILMPLGDKKGKAADTFDLLLHEVVVQTEKLTQHALLFRWRQRQRYLLKMRGSTPDRDERNKISVAINYLRDLIARFNQSRKPPTA